MDARDPLTFFFSDIEGSTRAATALGDRFASALEAHRRDVRRAFAEHRGVEVSTAGDSFFAVFDAPGDAIGAAVAIQRTLASAAGGANGLRARIGLHSGTAVRVGADYLGLDVHRAARVADAGHGGQILVSGATREALEDALPDGVSLVDLGRHRLKDVGPMRLWLAAGAGLPPGPFPPPRSLEAHPSNLPAGGPAIIGRDRERATLARLLAGGPVVSVTGPAGIGKSRLAIEVARAVVADFADGVFYVELATMPDAAAAAASLADVAGVRLGADDPALPALIERFRDSDVLIMFDTADRVVGLPSLVAAIAGACPRIRVLVTTRTRLRIAAERELSVAPLPVAAAAELFARRAAEVRPGFLMDPATRRVVERLVTHLDGIPLAIELAAARVRLFSPAALVDRLERRLPALGEAAADAPERQRTLQAAIAWSVELLTPVERSAFAQLGVFAGSFDLLAAEAVIDAADSDALSTLEQLVDRSLVTAEAPGLPHAGEDAPTPISGDSDSADAGGAAVERAGVGAVEAAAVDAVEAAGVDSGPRFRLLGPIRDFALDTLRAAGAEAAARDRHARAVLMSVRREAQALDDDFDLGSIARLRQIEAETRAALDWCLADTRDRGGAAVAFELAAGLGRYWHFRGQVREGIARYRKVLTLDANVAADIRARALAWAGVLYDEAGEPREASSCLAAALTIRQDSGDEVQAARVLNSLGVVARSMGDLVNGERLLRESLEKKRELGDRRGIATSLSNLGIVASDAGRLDEAVDLMRQAYEIDQESGGAIAIIGAANLGSALVRAGRLDEGLSTMRRALPGIGDLADPELVIEALETVAGVALASGGRGSSLPYAAARLLVAAERIRTSEHVRLTEVEQHRLDAARLQALATIGDPDAVRAIEAEARAIDPAAGVALARAVADELAARPDLAKHGT
jgi:predicted ATPase/class 3 adenylate cyclase